MKKLALVMSNMTAGLFSGLVMVIVAGAVSALIFGDPLLKPYFSIGMSCVLLGSIIVNLFTASLGSFTQGIARVESVTGLIISLIFTSIIHHSMAGASVLPTLLAILVLTSLLTGVFMMLMGYFRLGEMVRFLPYPVLGGIIAGTAWMMFFSSLKLINKDFFSSFRLLQTAEIMQFATAFSLVVISLFMIRSNKRPWLLPVIVIIFSILANICLYFGHVSYEQAIQTGWLFNPFHPGLSFHSFHLGMINQVDWSAIAHHWAYIASLIGYMLIVLLLNVGGLETFIKINANLNQDLKVSGAANILGAFFNAAPCNLSLSGTILNANLGANSRIAGIIASLASLLIFFGIPALISYLPIPVIAGLLLYISTVLLIEWIYKAWFIIPRVDYGIVIVILLVIANWGFLSGVLIGIIITSLVFVVRYAKISAIKFSVYGSEYSSTVSRPLNEQKWLMEQGYQLILLKLHGYLFFGSIKLLLDQIIHILEAEQERLKFIILDFEQVSGLDSSANFGFTRLRQHLSSYSVQLIFSNCSSLLMQQLEQQYKASDQRPILFFANSDESVEWCEEQLLLLIPEQHKLWVASIADTLTQIIPDPEEKEIFIDFLEREVIDKEQNIFIQGEIADCMYFLESGTVTIFLESNHDLVFRLSKCGPGTIFGEMGFYLSVIRTATVRTATNCIVYKLTREKLNDLENLYPEVALHFHKNIVKVMANRLSRMNNLLQRHLT